MPRSPTGLRSAASVEMEVAESPALAVTLKDFSQLDVASQATEVDYVAVCWASNAPSMTESSNGSRTPSRHSSMSSIRRCDSHSFIDIAQASSTSSGSLIGIRPPREEHPQGSRHGSPPPSPSMHEGPGEDPDLEEERLPWFLPGSAEGPRAPIWGSAPDRPPSFLPPPPRRKSGGPSSSETAAQATQSTSTNWLRYLHNGASPPGPPARKRSHPAGPLRSPHPPELALAPAPCTLTPTALNSAPVGGTDGLPYFLQPSPPSLPERPLEFSPLANFLSSLGLVNTSSALDGPPDSATGQTSTVGPSDASPSSMFQGIPWMTPAPVVPPALDPPFPRASSRPPSPAGPPLLHQDVAAIVAAGGPASPLTSPAARSRPSHGRVRRSLAPSTQRCMEEEAEDGWAFVTPSLYSLPFADYVLGPTVGKGCFGKVKMAMHRPTGQKVAIKMMRKDLLIAKGMQAKAMREITVLRVLHHPLIVRLFQVIETRTDIFMVMEYANGGELFEYITANWPLKRHILRFLFQQLILGVDHLHRHWCVHRDLKPENVLLDQKLNLKIADFGLSTRLMDGGFLATSCGTPNYAAPEVLSGKLYAGPEVDVWSCGVILYTMECGRLPFDVQDGRELLRRVCAAQYHVPNTVNPAVADVMRGMLCVDPIHRFTIAQIKAHRFFRERLPQYLADLASDSKVPLICEDVLRYTCAKLNLSVDEGRVELQKGPRGPVWTCYHILAGAKAKLGTRLFSYVEANLGTKDLGVYGLRPSPLMEALYAEEVGISSRISYSRCTQEPPAGPQFAPWRQLSSRFKSRDKWQLVLKRLPKFDTVNSWRLGIFTDFSVDYLIRKVYSSLKVLHMVWKVVAPFHLRCRTTSGSVNIAAQQATPVKRKWSDLFLKKAAAAAAAADPTPAQILCHSPVTIEVRLFRIARYGHIVDFAFGAEEPALPALEVILTLARHLSDLVT